MKLSHFFLLCVFLIPRNFGQYTFSRYDSCSDCPRVGRTNGEDETSNYNPKLDFSCDADYPIDWTFHYDEDEQVEIQQRTAVYRRNVENFTTSSSYEYQIHVTVEYPQRLQYFPNFTCLSTQDVTKLTRLVISGNTEFFRVSASTSPNDYVVRKPSQGCEAFNYFTLAPPIPYSNGVAVGPCFNCFRTRNATQRDFDEHLVPKKYTCGKPPLCQSLWQYRQGTSKKCMYTSITPTHEDGADWDGGCLSDQRDQIFCFVKDGRSCFVSEDLGPFVVSCRGNSESTVRGAQLGFYGMKGLANGNLATRPKAYFSWADAPKQEMVELSRRNDTMLTYVGQEVEFQCKISSYYCAWPIWMSTTVLGEDPEYVQMTINTYPRPDTFWNRTTLEKHAVIGEYYNAFFKFLAVLPKDIQVSCYCPVFNSSEWIRDSVTVIVNDVEAPKIVSLVQDNPQPLIIGETNRSVECEFSGHPISEVSWLMDDSPVSQDLYTVITHWDKNTSTLLIPEVLRILGSHLTCKVTTFFDSAEDEISLEIEEKVISTSNYLTGTITSVFITTMLICSFVIYRLWKVNQRQRDLLRNLTDDEINEFKLGNPNYSMEFHPMDCGNLSVQTLPFDEKYQIPLKDVEIDHGRILGAGAFGMVFKGELEIHCDTNNLPRVVYANLKLDSKLPVAVKTVKPDVEVEYFKALLSELKILGHVGTHVNVVRLLGACTEEIRDRKVYIIVEFCVNGSLESFLRNEANRQRFVNVVEYGRIKADEDKIQRFNNDTDAFTTLNLFKWSADIANGLQHVHKQNIIHGDLAIRNILLSEDLTAKISDFGLSRQLINSANYVKKTQVPLPWRHMPPEALQEKNFSKSSDIWAFGVVLWEIFELGRIPYGGETWSYAFLTGIISGTRLSKPRYATNELYEYVLQCWELEPADRARAEGVIPVVNNSIETIDQLCRQFTGVQ